MSLFTFFEGEGHQMEGWLASTDLVDHNEITTLHSIHLKFFPFHKSKQKYCTIKVFDLLNQVT